MSYLVTWHTQHGGIGPVEADKVDFDRITDGKDSVASLILYGYPTPGCKTTVALTDLRHLNIVKGEDR